MSVLRGKVAIITGASSGIGAGTAIHFAGLNCQLCLSGRNESNLRNTAQECVKAGISETDILIEVADVAKDEDVHRIVTNTIERFGRLDILVNAAGILIPGGVETLSMEGYDETMQVNVRSVVLFTQLAMPHLKKTRGNIVNVSSITGIRSFPGVMSYCMSKAAVDQLTRCTALEVARDGVRVNSVNPGVIVTDFHKRGGMTDSDYAKFLEHCNETHALGRAGTVDEVAQAIAFLSSDISASFITGVNLPVDGGRGVMCPR